MGDNFKTNSTTTTANEGQRNPIEALSKEELLSKYKGLLSIAKKAKLAKDEMAEENRQLKETLSRCETQKEADKKALLTMKEMLEALTNNKLELTNQLSELQQKFRNDEEILAQMRIENESLKRQLTRLTDDNDNLLQDLERREDQLQQVNLLGIEQKKHLELLELEVNKLKEAESLNASLKNQITVTLAENKHLKEQENANKKTLEELKVKYDNVKEINSNQRHKFNALKERFVDIYRKLKKLKECKKLLLETHRDYADSVGKWQNDIIHASHMLCKEINALKQENDDLTYKLTQNGAIKSNETNITAATTIKSEVDVQNIIWKLQQLHILSQTVCTEQKNQKLKLMQMEQDNTRLNTALIKMLEYNMSLYCAENKNLYQPLINDLKNLKLQLMTSNEGTTSYITLLENIDIVLMKIQRKIEDDIEKPVTIEKKKLFVEKSEEKLIEKQTSKQKETQTEIETEIVCEKLAQISIETQTPTELLITNETQTETETRIENETQTETEIATISEKLLQKSIQTQTQETELTESINDTNADSTKSVLLNYQQNYEDLLSRYESKEREHTDLLDEMRELNEALKARGDVISRQEVKQQELLCDLKKVSVKLEQFEEQLTAKELLLTEKEQQIRHVSKEIENARCKVKELEMSNAKNAEQMRILNEDLQNMRSAVAAETNNADNQSDIMSTSTISRADEYNRLRELDESFEEKYNKLRGLAVKLKKKLQEQTLQLSELEKQQQSTQNLQKELDNHKQKSLDLQNDLDICKSQLEILRVENQKLKSSKKQANVLNLEIEAVEKSLKDVTDKLTIKTQELETLNEALKSKESNIVQLRRELSILEAAKEAECNHSKELKEQIDLMQQQVKDAVHNKLCAITAQKDLEQQHENLKLQIEELRWELSNNMSQNELILTKTQNDKAQMEHQLLEIEEILKNTQQHSRTTERALEELRIEYLEYKLKAQTVLRKNQNKDTTKERELEDELIALRAVEKQMQITAQMHLKKIEDLNQQLDELKIDYENCQKRINDLMDFIEDFRKQNESLSLDNRRQLQIHQDALRNHLKQIESLDTCHKQQLQDIEVSYMKKLEQLKIELAKMQRTSPLIGATSASINNANATANQQQQQHQTQMTAHHYHLMNSSSIEQNKIDYLLMEREDAEGSEAGDNLLANLAANRKISNASSSQRRRSQHELMPLDELLNVPMNTFSDTVTTITSNSYGRNKEHNNNNNANESNSESDINSNFEHLQQELQTTKERLQIQESRVRHLTTLLAENEQDLARLTQMNDMLKEELRRQERAEEREKHMHNSEYMKNVIIKFLTLNNGDERLHLVPVLNTILKLTKNETEILNCVAKGQKVPSDSHSSRGWGSFLSSWSSVGSGGSTGGVGGTQ